MRHILWMSLALSCACSTDKDSSTDSASTEADADTDSDVGSGSLVIYAFSNDGSYDECRGTSEASLKSAAVSGTGACSFSGDFSGVGEVTVSLTGTLSGSAITGTYTTNTDMAGDLSYEGEIEVP